MPISDNAAARLQALLDRQDIYDLVCRYCRGVDRLDHDLIRACYWDDASDDRGFFQGGPDAFAAFAIKASKLSSSTHHLIGNALIEVEGDVAFGEIYLLAQHRTQDKTGAAIDFFVGGRYVDRYERRGGEWRIAHRTELTDWVRSDPVSDGWLQEVVTALRGARGNEDLVMRKDLLRKR